MSGRRCAVFNCENTYQNSDCIFYTFPKVWWKREQRDLWISAIRKNNPDGSIWLPKPDDRLCSAHFIGGRKADEQASPSYVPTLFPPDPYFYSKSRRIDENAAIMTHVSEQDAKSDPSDEAPVTPPWHPGSPGASDLSYLQDPLRKTTEQCRFCGEFSNECVAVSSHMPYVVGDKTTLSLNDMSVQLDFNNAILNTVCRDCDNKLTEFSAFVKLVKTSQDILANDVKTECESIADNTDLTNISDRRTMPEDDVICYIEDVKPEITDMDFVIKTETEGNNESNVELDFSTFEEAVVVKRISRKRKDKGQKVKVTKIMNLNTVECDNEFLEASRCPLSAKSGKVREAHGGQGKLGKFQGGQGKIGSKKKKVYMSNKRLKWWQIGK